MKNLLLVRHAKSSWDYPALNDFERPLNDRGKRDAPKMAEWLSDNSKIDIILSSTAKRAKDTALALQAHQKTSLVYEEKLYHASRSQLFKTIKQTAEIVDCIAIVSHNPGLNDLADFLLDGFYENIPTMGIVSIDLNIKKWSEASPKNASLQFFQFPKNL